MLKFLVFKSFRNRKFVSLLSVISISLSLSLFLMVEKMRDEIENSFTNSISNADLIVGARSGSLQLLLYSIFHMGSPTNNITYKTYEEIKSNPVVDWTIQLSLGDSYKGHRVVGTTYDFFKHYQFHGDQHLKMSDGRWNENLYDVVIGSQIAKELKLKLGDEIVLSHGLAENTFLNHENSPFKVRGVLKVTGTPVDKSLYINLEGMEAIHGEVDSENIEISQITSFILRTKNRIALLQLQRFVANYKKEALSAIIPAMSLAQLWKLLDQIERAFLTISIFVILVGFCSMLISLYMSLNDRQREMIILRSLGASAGNITTLLIVEASIISMIGGLLGFILQYGVLFALSPLLDRYYSIIIPLTVPTEKELVILIYFILLGPIFGLIPAYKAYKISVSNDFSSC